MGRFAQQAVQPESLLQENERRFEGGRGKMGVDGQSCNVELICFSDLGWEQPHKQITPMIQEVSLNPKMNVTFFANLVRQMTIIAADLHPFDGA